MKRETSGTKGTHHITSRNSCVFCLLVVFFICSSLFCSFVMKSTNRTNRTNKTQNQNLDVKVEWKEKRTSERMKRARVRAFPLVSLHSTSLCSFFFHSSLSSSFIGLFVMDWKNEGSTKQANEKKMNKAQRIQYIFLCLLVLFLCLLSIKNKGKRRERAHALFNWKKDKEPTNN